MKQFIAKFTDRIDGVLCGFDRLVMRGELRALYIAKGGGIEQYLRSSHVMFKDFGEHVLEVSRRLKEASLAAALELGRVVRYVPSAAASKEDIARQIAAEQKIQSGLVCVLSSVEPCMSFQAVPNRETKKLDFKLEQRKCLHLYHYLIPESGVKASTFGQSAGTASCLLWVGTPSTQHLAPTCDEVPCCGMGAVLQQ